MNIILSRFFVTILLFIGLASSSLCQVPVGTITTTFGQSFRIYNNFFVEQIEDPNNRFWARRDPSGIMYAQLYSANQNAAFFIDWNNNLVRVDMFNGVSLVGTCHCPPLTRPIIWQPPTYTQGLGVEIAPGRIVPIPQPLLNLDRPFGNIMITSEQKARKCYNDANGPSGLDQQQFGDCMVEAMVGRKEYQIYECMSRASSAEERALCTVSVLGGPDEQNVAYKLINCYRQFGTDYEKYSLCLMSQQSDPKLARLAGCLQQQASSGGSISPVGTALCYYGPSMLNLNPEMQIVMHCAIATGGHPYAFTSCAGGQLSARELNKCLQHGIGGENGCFGDNNDVLKAIRNMGDYLSQQLGENNDLVRAWRQAANDLTVGPGPSNDGVRILRNVGNEVSRASENVAREVKKVMPRVKVKFSW